MELSSSASHQEYQCTCGHKQSVSVKDIEENYKFTGELSKRLKDIYGPIPCMPPGEYSAIMKVETTCDICQGLINITVEVNGVPLWNHDVFFGHFEPWIENFSDIRIVRVLPFTSNVVGYRLDRFIEEPFLEPEFDDLPHLDDIPNSQEKEAFVHLTIFVQTSMRSGYCHLGFDFQSGRILRPLYRPKDGCCCWDVPLDVDQTYAFRILSSPRDDSERFTPLPHSNDDLLVQNQAIRMESNEPKPNIFYQLKKVSKLSVEDIFGPQIKEKKYIDEGTDCPSVGVLSCEGRDLKPVRDPFDNSKRRIKISGGYVPRITAFDARELPEELPDKPTLVILGLGRPFAGTGQNHYEPRCYILVLRIFQNP